MEATLNSLTVRVAASDELPTVMRLFDDRVQWLNSKGITGQWGTEPISQYHSFVEIMKGCVDRGEVHFSVEGDEVTGMLALEETAPDYCSQWFTEGSMYIRALVTSASAEGKGVGRALLLYAEKLALDAGKNRLQLDCWAESPVLPKYYESNGYTLCGRFEYKGWKAASYAKAVAKSV